MVARGGGAQQSPAWPRRQGGHGLIFRCAAPDSSCGRTRRARVARHEQVAFAAASPASPGALHRGQSESGAHWSWHVISLSAPSSFLDIVPMRTAATILVFAVTAVLFSACGTTATPPPSAPHVGPDVLQARWSSESVDADWAVAQEARVEEIVAQTPTCTDADIACRSSICRVTLTDCLDDPPDVSLLTMAIREAGDFGEVHSEYRTYEVGTVSVVAFFQRSADEGDDHAQVAGHGASSGEQSGAASVREGCRRIGFRRIEGWEPLTHLDRFDQYIQVQSVDSAEAFRARFGVEAPPSLDFDTEWALIVRSDQWHRFRAELVELLVCDRDGLEPVVATRPMRSCEPLIDSQMWGEVTLYAVARDDAPFHDVRQVGHEDAERFMCAEEGVTEGAVCQPERLCQPGLICAGLTVADEGTCVPIERRASVTSSVTTEIPDARAQGVAIENHLTDVEGTVSDVAITARITHPAAHELRIELESPSGRRAVVWDHEAESIFLYRAVAGLGGERAGGTWTLHVVDDVTGNRGQVESWELTVVTIP